MHHPSVINLDNSSRLHIILQGKKRNSQIVGRGVFARSDQHKEELHLTIFCYSRGLASHRELRARKREK